jgi:hypothetical protein
MMSTIDPAAARRERRARRAGDRRVLAGALCGATVMTACAVLLGLAVGETADLLRDSAINSSFDEREPYPVCWGIGTIGLLWTLGAFGTMLGFAGLVVAYAERHRRRLRRLLADRDRLLAEGRRTRGVITDAAFRTAVNDQGQRSVVGVEVTVKYSDDHGVERWVSRFSHGRTAMPATGFADVLFDPVRPGVDRLVFVVFHRDPDPADWIGPAI